MKKIFLLITVLLTIVTGAKADVTINRTNFPDDKFRNYLLALRSGRDGVFTDEAQAYNPPSLDQIKELFDNTTSEWTTLNGVNGRKFTGSNGGFVFLPAAGYVWDGELYDVGSYGDYWSSTLFEGVPNNAWYLYFYSGGVRTDDGNRSRGRSVRPVR